MILRPPPILRLVNALPGMLLAGATFTLVLSDDPELGTFRDRLLTWAIMFFLPGIYLAVRAYRMSVALTSDVVRIRGWLWSRTVPRASIVGVGVVPWWVPIPYYIPTLRWNRPSGGVRSSPMLVLGVPVSRTVIGRRPGVERLATLMHALEIASEWPLGESR